MQQLRARNNQTQKLAEAWIFLLILLMSPASAMAGSPVFGAKSTGMGSAFTAVADDASAVAFNPAGLADQKGLRVYGGGTLIMPSTRFENPAGESERTKFKAFFPPFLYLSDDFGLKDMSLGLGLYAPLGIGGRYWSREGLTRYASTESTIASFAVNPVLAWRVTPWLAVGGGPYYMLVQNTAEKMMDQSMFSWSDARFNLDGTGDCWEYSLGLLITPVKQWNIGFCYRSGCKTHIAGTAKLENIAPAVQGMFGGSGYRSRVQSSIDLPAFATFGVAWMPTENLTIDADFSWSGWSSFKEQELEFSNKVPAAGLDVMILPEDWKNTWTYIIGFNLKIRDDLSVRAGYVYGNNQVPEETLSPASPEADQQSLSMGLGYSLSRNTVLDVFYMLEVFRDREVQNTILSGTYENTGHLIGAALGYRY